MESTNFNERPEPTDNDVHSSARAVCSEPAMRCAITTLAILSRLFLCDDAVAQVITCPSSTTTVEGDILVSNTSALVRVDPLGVQAPETIVTPGYSAIVYDDQGRLIGNRGSQILAVDLNACAESVLSEGGPLSDARDMVVVGDMLYATDDSGGVRGVIEVNLATGEQRLVTSSAGISFPDTPNLLNPRGITLNRLGHLFVVDQGSPSGGSDGRIIFVNPRTPFDPSDPQGNQTVIASGAGASLPKPGVVYTNFEMQDPLGIVADLDNNELLVTDQARVMRFDENGVLQSTINVNLPLLYFNDIEINDIDEFVATGHDTYGTFHAVIRVNAAGDVSNLTPDPGEMRWPRHVLIVPAVTASTTTTTTTLPSPACGNVDGSATITASDALAVLGAAVGSRTCDPCICDVDASGGITASDALNTLRKAVGLPAELACPTCG